MPTEPAPRGHRRRMPASSVVGVMALLLLLIVAASSGDEALWSGTDTVTPEALEREAPSDVVAPTSSPSSSSGGALSVGGAVFEVLGVLLLVAVGAVVVLSLRPGTSSWARVQVSRRRRSRLSTPMPDAPRAIEVDDDAVFASLSEGTPRNAIVRCWMVLEESAAAGGIRSEPAETSTEYVERVIAASSVDPAPISELGALFREARFSSRPVEESHRALAEHTLRRALDSLGATKDTAP